MTITIGKAEHRESCNISATDSVYQDIARTHILLDMLPTHMPTRGKEFVEDDCPSMQTGQCKARRTVQLSSLCVGWPLLQVDG